MKITEYPSIEKFTADNVFLVDGDAGTKKILAADAVLAALGLNSVYNRRTVFRGKNLGSTVTAEQKAAIQAGTFDGLFLGDYWEISGVKWRIADFDYWYGKGDSEFASHHVVIVPDSNLTTAAYDTSGMTLNNKGYTGSTVYTTTLPTVKATVSGIFGSSLLSHREYLIDAWDNTVGPSGGAWTDSTVDLMNEPMVFGSYIYTPIAVTTSNSLTKRYTNSFSQLALFAVRPSFIYKPDGASERISYLLRDICGVSRIVRVTSYGAPQDTTVTVSSYGIRPAFAIG